MSYINSVVDKVYVINLDRDTEKMKVLDTNLREHNVRYTRFPAVIGAHVTESRYLSPFCNKFCAPGMKGCALSHRAIWEDMVHKNYNYALILEDDAQLTTTCQQEFKQAWDQVPDDFDIVWVGCNFVCDDPGVIPHIMRETFYGHPEKVDDNLNRTPGSVGTHAYIISRKCAEKLLAAQINTHIDMQLSLWIRQHNLQSYSMHPQPIRNNPEMEAASSISEKYPKLLNTLLSRIPTSRTTKLDWALSEQLLQLGPFTVTPLLMIIFLLALLLPLEGAAAMVVWLLAEGVFAGDAVATVKFLTFIGIAAGIKVGVRKLYK
jgi:GR25 family glycosyltransferase involved in LPS biosynthesis